MIANEKTLRLAALAFAFGEEIEGYVYTNKAIEASELEQIALDLHALNVRAYNGRYRDNLTGTLEGRLFQSHALYRIKAEGFGSVDHLKWVKALRFVRYQCAEDATIHDELYLRMERAETAFFVALTTLRPDFEGLPWGE